MYAISKLMKYPVINIYVTFMFIDRILRWSIYAFMLIFFTIINNTVTVVWNINFIMNNERTVEQEKLVAEKLNGRFEMIGFIEAIGAYLTTSQIIPGFV